MKVATSLLTLTLACFSMQSHADGWLSEPKPIDGIEGNPFRVVEYQPGKVIRLVAARGQSMMVEMPAGWEAFRVNQSEQDVMMNTVIPQTRNAPAEGDVAGSECTMRPNLEVCVQRERFILFKPVTPLDPQPVPVLMLQTVAGKPSREVPVMFRLETATDGEQPYYGVRVTLPTPMPAAVAHAASAAVRRPVRSSVPAMPPVRHELAVPPINNAYRIEGDRTLLGEPGR